MKSYMLSGAHRQVMRKLFDWCDEAAVAHWTQDSGQEPTWQEAHTRLLNIGRLSKVNHPSKAQSEFHIPVPHVALGGEVRF